MNLRPLSRSEVQIELRGEDLQRRTEALDEPASRDVDQPRYYVSSKILPAQKKPPALGGGFCCAGAILHVGNGDFAAD